MRNKTDRVTLCPVGIPKEVALAWAAGLSGLLLWGASAGIGMLCGFVAGVDHLFPAVASREVIHMVPPLVAIPASAGILFLHHEHPCSIGFEI